MKTVLVAFTFFCVVMFAVSCGAAIYFAIYERATLTALSVAGAVLWGVSVGINSITLTRF